MIVFGGLLIEVVENESSCTYLNVVGILCNLKLNGKYNYYAMQVNFDAPFLYVLLV